MQSIGEIIAGISELPTFPAVAMKVLRTVRDPTYTTDELTAAISLDAAITAKMLKLCNSSYWGLRCPVGTVQEAVVFLGQRTILNLVLVSCAADMFRDSGGGYIMDPGALWRHSVGCAIGADLLARRSSNVSPDKAFTAGLFHDVGKIVLNEHMRAQLPEVLQRCAEGRTFVEAEREVLGLHHGEIGGLLVESWDFPEELVQAVRFHHEPCLAGEHQSLAVLAHVADILCLTMGIGAGADGLAYRAMPGALEMLQLGREEIPRLGLELVESLKMAQEFLEL
ncbi:MAG: HDOD domain-containing protein [Planctomycetota bacterium]